MHRIFQANGEKTNNNRSRGELKTIFASKVDAGKLERSYSVQKIKV